MRRFPDGELRHSKLPELAGMSVRGPYLPNFEELVAFAGANIPQGDGLVMIDGEDPFYYVTGRTPQFPVLLFDPTTQPYSPEETLDEIVIDKNIRWLVVKRRSCRFLGGSHAGSGESDAGGAGARNLWGSGGWRGMTFIVGGRANWKVYSPTSNDDAV